MFILNDENLMFTDVVNYDEKVFRTISFDLLYYLEALPYAMYDNKLVLIINDHFDYFKIPLIDVYFNKINFNHNYYLYKVEQNYFDKIANLISINFEHHQAVNEYSNQFQENDNKLSNLELNEENQVFYNAEVKNYPIVKMVDSLLEEAISLNASDVHIEPSVDEIKIRYRIDGTLYNRPSLPKESLNEISTRVKVLSKLDITKHHLPQDGKFKFDCKDLEYDIRVSILPIIHGEMITFRIFKDNINGQNDFTIEDLKLSSEERDIIESLINSKDGLILVVGPTGSGKSSTLQAFLKDNVKRGEKIITVEDPVEHPLENVDQVQINLEAGLTFSVVLKNILRQDPNIIMIGEIRDNDTASIASRAALTGHLVYSTLHTPNSLAVFNRLLDMNVEPFILSDSIKGIISERLVRTLCNECKKPKVIEPNSLESKYLGESYIGKTIYEKCGCPKCNMSGYLGRRPIFEIIKVTKEFQELVMQKAPITQYEKLLVKKKIPTLQMKALELIFNGETSIEEIKRIIS